MAQSDRPRPRPTAGRLVLHLAPAILAWLYGAWRIAGTNHDLLASLYPVQLALAVLAFAAALFATRLPASGVWKRLLILASLAGFVFLLTLGPPIYFAPMPD